MRKTDPKAVQDKVADRAKEAQATVQSKFAEVVGSLDTDLKKFGETAQDLALRGVGVAAEYAVKAREKYEEVAAHGEEAVKAWRGEMAEEITEIAVVVEPEPEAKPAAKAETKAETKAEEPAAKAEVPKPTRKTTARKPVAKKTAAAEK